MTEELGLCSSAKMQPIRELIAKAFHGALQMGRVGGEKVRESL